MSQTAIGLKNFFESARRKIKRFWAQEGEMTQNSICKKRDENGIKRFWAQEAEMSLTAISSHESPREKFFMNSTYIVSRK